MNATQIPRRIIAGMLLSGILEVASLGLSTGIAHAGAFHWCPGDPLPSIGGVSANPDWDTTVCHDYAWRGNEVMEGNPRSLPSFQWFQYPPGTTPVPQMPVIPNK